jgi:FAD/FMN-containing dehydrogenase/Fe-S oxidoreductase
MSTDLDRIRSVSGCEIRADALTRQLYATDASIYQIVPRGVAFPKSPEQAAALVRAAADENVPLIPRGAGTGLAGGAVGDGLVVDFARYNRGIRDFDPETRSVRVDPGVVLDQLNAFLKPHGFRFGPDVATSSRATLGGMIANNSSGSHVPVYGTTGDHVRALDIVLTDGRLERIGPMHNPLPEMHQAVEMLVDLHRGDIDRMFPEGMLKRWPGYGVDRWLRTSPDLTRIVSGSEGTLVSIVSAELNVVPLPGKKGLGVICFASVEEAMEATVELLELEPAAIEHIDDVLFDQTLGQLPFRRARTLLELDEHPCKAILLVEFFGDFDDKLGILRAKNLGLRTRIFPDEADQNAIWNLRKAGLSLLTGCPGNAKPATFIEDIAVRPDQLPAYVRGLRSILAPLGIDGSYYGHAATGLLHVRPVIDLHKAGDLEKFRRASDEVFALVREFKGSIAGEHGVGLSRTEYMPEHVGPELMNLFERIKTLFDPKGLMNPGKIIPDGRFAIHKNLRQGPDAEIRLPFEPVLAFAAKDHSFIGNLEQCNGCGGCRKDAPTMCPTYLATGEEIMSTRGRANTIRAVLEGRIGGELDAPELDEALSNCLSCKACTTECPSNVNMALLKAELLHARLQRDGLSLRDRMVSRIDLAAALSSLAPGLANFGQELSFVRAFLNAKAGFAPERPLPRFAMQRFDRWFDRHPKQRRGDRGRVLLWDDCFTRYYDPHIGRAAVRALETLGYEVERLRDRACCGRPAFSTGRLELARDFGNHNARLVEKHGGYAPIVFLEPSCFSMFEEDYRELGVQNADALRARAVLFEDFAADALGRNGIAWKNPVPPVAIHGHCHAKSLTEAASMPKALANAGGAVTRLNTGCCGMAGSFGQTAEKYALSLQVAQPLVDQLGVLSPETVVVANGTSCRHQIEHLTDRKPKHFAEVLADALT